MSRKYFHTFYLKNKNYAFNDGNFLLNIFINKLMKDGKKCIANKILLNMLNLIKIKLNINSAIEIVEYVINEDKNLFLIKKGKDSQHKKNNTLIQSITECIINLIIKAKSRSFKNYSINLANEVIERYILLKNIEINLIN